MLPLQPYVHFLTFFSLQFYLPFCIAAYEIQYFPVWDITLTENIKGEIRLAGGSYLCSPSTCHGTQPDRELFVDKETANTHISFAVYTP